ncbi:ankyrin repeat and fibronectin type-III domain-containing protein 1-like isoform X2 [Macrosteles quadrilineatus]|uniref:ankyrin repeat and fibronectin type-III domain-containing protein 1-like isoform X2 n=1 Tax=Macrosteles quadrilineatus TaxID=74068 RepID=UPI0023E27A02|nr:ankyrin repeat and fibronectin type-III domain-containing protein 1-like isoform X2 [Macrosteles quadrilineatus]
MVSIESKRCNPLSRRTPSPLTIPKAVDRPPPLSPSVARRLKGQRAVSALFAAVEHGHVEKAKTILESTDVDVNSVNSDGLTPLDVAVLSNNRGLTKVLLTQGAREGNKFGSPDKLLAHLRQLACEAERRVAELGGGAGEDVPRSAPPYPATSDKTLALWERRCKGLNKMIQGFEQARPPDVPFLVAVDVTGTNSVTVRYQEPDNSDSPPCTKFRVEWSSDPEFSTIVGHREVTDVKKTELSVDGLTHGQRYYFRAACGNLRGYSHYRLSQPDCVIPSSWRDVTGREERLPPGGLALLDRLFAEVRSSRPDLKGLPSDQGPGDTPLGQRRKKTTIKQLFTAASKFQKHLRRGVFLSCLLYHEDKVLVTNEDFLPVIEVDETYPGSIYHDFHWLLKVACTWDDVKWLRQDMEKSLSSSAVHFRIKLLQAAAQMQTALSIQDLGQLYHKPLRDSEGTVVICTVNYVGSPKTVSVLNSRWLPLGKLSKRAVPGPDANIAEILMSTIQEQITYHQVSSIRLPRGLYLAYLKMRSCVDLLQVLVPAKSPNVPPHCKIRDNPHVTAEEWEALLGGERCGLISEHQKAFVEQVAATARRLFTYMEVSTDDAALHRLYDLETVEISPDVSLLMVVPPVDSACSAPGQRETLLQRPDLLPLPVQVFEMVHLGTYRHQIVQRYSRLSCIIELDMALANHSQREAFSNTELTVAKERLARLEALQAQLNTAWKQCRWLLDVLSFARDRATHTPSTMGRLLACHPKRSHDHIDCQNGLLQPPDPKAVKSRGSWPGPGTGRTLGAVTAELSRSEQHLSNNSPPPPPLPPPRPQPTSPPPQTQLYPAVSENVRLPPSRSEDTLVHNRGSQPRPRCSVSVTTSPLLSSRPQFGSGSLHSLSSDDSASASVMAGSHSKSEGEEEGATVPNPSPGILQVYAAYDTGLAAGTSLKLHVSPRTSAREVVDLVVKQLNMAVVLKGKDGPIYPADQLHNFCLVAVIGARERCLRDDFKPLQLQNPWKKGRLYVRQKHDVLAALEHSSRHSAFL